MTSLGGLLGRRSAPLDADLRSLRQANPLRDDELHGLAASPQASRLCEAILASGASRGPLPAAPPVTASGGGGADPSIAAVSAPQVTPAPAGSSDPLVERLRSANPVRASSLDLPATAAGAASERAAIASAPAMPLGGRRWALAHSAARCSASRRRRSRPGEALGAGLDARSLRAASAAVLTADDGRLIDSLRLADPVRHAGDCGAAVRELSPAALDLQEAILTGRWSRSFSARRSWRRPAVLVPAAALAAVAAAAATYGVVFVRPSQPEVVSCFASDHGGDSLVGTLLDGSPVRGCQALWQSGAFSSLGYSSAPRSLVACVLPSGAYAVLPGSDDSECTTRGLAAALPLDHSGTALAELQAVISTQVDASTDCVSLSQARSALSDAVTRLGLSGWSVRQVGGLARPPRCAQAAISPALRQVVVFSAPIGLEPTRRGYAPPVNGDTGSQSGAGATGAPESTLPAGSTTSNLATTLPPTTLPPTTLLPGSSSPHGRSGPPPRS